MQIDIDHVSKNFGSACVLQGVELTIPTGMFGLLGPNGAGKTTLMRILAGIMRPSTGRVHIGPFAMDTTDGRREIQKRLGYLPQEFGLYPDLSATEFLNYVSLLKGMDDLRYRRERINLLLDTVGLADMANHKLRGFSGGMKRRVGIAQALLQQPQVLIVDEPTAGLDPEERVHFRNLLVGLAVDRTVLLSTHIIEDVAQTASRLAVIVQGRIAFHGEVDNLLEAARGLIWTLNSAGAVSLDAASVVSAIHMGTATHYRIISEESPAAGAVQADPTLEDGYLVLMRRMRA